MLMVSKVTRHAQWIECVQIRPQLVGKASSATVLLQSSC